MDTSEIRAMDPEDLEERLLELQEELMHERGTAAMGGAPPNPGRIRHLRRVVARIKTVQNEQKRGSA